MNKAILMGRIVRDPELRTTNSQVPVATFTIATDRKFKSASGERESDFIPCVAWRSQAEFVSKFFQKGNKILVVGSIQARNWEDKDGNKRTATEVIVDEIYFVESKGQRSEHHEAVNAADSDESLPFDL